MAVKYCVIYTMQGLIPEDYGLSAKDNTLYFKVPAAGDYQGDGTEDSPLSFRQLSKKGDDNIVILTLIDKSKSDVYSNYGSEYFHLMKSRPINGHSDKWTNYTSNAIKAMYLKATTSENEDIYIVIMSDNKGISLVE